MKIAKEKINLMSEGQLQKLVFSLQQGGVIAFPTETVYALAGDARSLSAIKRIFRLKARPLTQPLSVLLPQNHDLAEWANDVSPLAQRLADYFWPGPLTLIFNKKASVLSELSGGGSKVGLRVPDHPVAQSILQAFAGGLAAPSANRSAHLSPTQATHVRQAFADELDAIVDGGACSIGIESTIVDVSSDSPRILRLGAISQEAIQRVIGSELVADSSVLGRIRLPLRQIERDELENSVHHYLNQGKSITVLARQPARVSHTNLIWITMPEEASDYGRVLYQHLHEAEKNSTTQILIESLPQNEAWAGIHALLRS
ncbi:L-threonylcarbamoyladenylate synthase [Rickettsiella endosymbiont of Dermanyssus gallinae]|uniref:L-threonylcarbamoyladenylate synthase n=1 Tax=Rickettsiella endosymbiont of Dermanyssus gallinae TaxID=2856608 RepID=UPI001C529376|nr:L-threonylcarbamoyladenylate synthase [Rickettsiella endosymbiont of Dermanyssus gallinae]